MAEGVE